MYYADLENTTPMMMLGQKLEACKHLKLFDHVSPPSLVWEFVKLIIINFDFSFFLICQDSDC